jgi:hypothetical protein
MLVNSCHDLKDIFNLKYLLNSFFMEIDEFPVIIECSAKEFSIREHLIRKRAKNFRLRLSEDTLFQKDNLFQITTDCFNVKRKRQF